MRRRSPFDDGEGTDRVITEQVPEQESGRASQVPTSEIEIWARFSGRCHFFDGA
jgi:hypothetical protein